MSTVDYCFSIFFSFHEGGSVAQRQLAVLVVAVNEATLVLCSSSIIRELAKLMIAPFVQRINQIVNFI